MKPISKLNFGPEADKIAITFHDGESVVDGHIIKQTGSKHFVVTSDGLSKHTIMLAQTTAAASALEAGLGTIFVAPHGVEGGEYVKHILGSIVFTTEGNRYSWKRGATADAGQAKITMVGDITAPQERDDGEEPIDE